MISRSFNSRRERRVRWFSEWFFDLGPFCFQRARSILFWLHGTMTICEGQQRSTTILTPVFIVHSMACRYALLLDEFLLNSSLHLGQMSLGEWQLLLHKTFVTAWGTIVNNWTFEQKNWSQPIKQRQISWKEIRHFMSSFLQFRCGAKFKSHDKLSESELH